MGKEEILQKLSRLSASGIPQVPASATPSFADGSATAITHSVDKIMAGNYQPLPVAPTNDYQPDRDTILTKLDMLSSKHSVEPRDAGEGAPSDLQLFGKGPSRKAPSEVRNMPSDGTVNDLEFFGGPKVDTKAAIAQTINEAKGETNASTRRNSEGFLSDIGNGLVQGFDKMDVLTAGLQSSTAKQSRSIMLKTIDNKIRNKEPLSSDENDLVEALKLKAQAEGINSAEGGKTIGYGAGSMTSSMIPFIEQIALTRNPRMGASALTKAALGLDEATPLLARMGIGTAANAAAGAVQTAMVPQQVMSIYADRRLSQYNISNDNGQPAISMARPESPISSFLKSTAEAFSMNWSMGMGEVFNDAAKTATAGLTAKMAGGAFGDWLAKASATASMAGSTANDWSTSVGLAPVRKMVSDTFGWHGPLSQFAEMQFYQVASPLLTGEPERLSNLTDVNNQLTMLTGVALGSIGFKLLEAPGYIKYGRELSQSREQYKDALTKMDPQYAEPMVEAFAMPTSEARTEALSKLPWEQMDANNRAAAIDAIFHKTRYDFMSGAKEGLDMDEAVTSIHHNTDAMAYRGTTNGEPSSHLVAQMNNGDVMLLVDGDVTGFKTDRGMYYHPTNESSKMMVGITQDGRRIAIKPSDVESIHPISREEIVSNQVQKWIDTRARRNQEQDTNDGLEDAALSSHQGDYTYQPAAPEEQEAPANQPSSAESNTTFGAESPAPESPYTPKRGDMVETPDGMVGKVVQSSHDGYGVKWLDADGNDQISFYRDGLKPYVPAEGGAPEATSATEADSSPAPAPTPSSDMEGQEAPTPTPEPTPEPAPDQPITQEAPQENNAQQPVEQPLTPVDQQPAEAMAPPSVSAYAEISKNATPSPSVSSPYYVSKNGKYAFTRDEAGLRIFDATGVEVPYQVNGHSNPKYNKLSQEYKEAFSYEQGDMGVCSSDANEEQAYDEIISSSSNPSELATFWLAEKAKADAIKTTLADDKTYTILAVAQASKVTKESIANSNGDANMVGASMAKTFISKDGKSLDELAIIASSELSSHGSDVEVTPQDVWDAISSYPFGADEYARSVVNANTKVSSIDIRFRSIAGFPISAKVAALATINAVRNTPEVANSPEGEEIVAVYDSITDEEASKLFAESSANLDTSEADTFTNDINEEVTKQNDISSVEQDLNPSYAERTDNNPEGSTAGNPTQEGGNEAGSDTGSESDGSSQEQERESGLTDNQQADYDRERSALIARRSELVSKLSKVRSDKSKAISKANERNGLFGDTSIDPNQQSIEGATGIDVKAGIQAITQKFNEQISSISNEINGIDARLSNLANIVASQLNAFSRSRAHKVVSSAISSYINAVEQSKIEGSNPIESTENAVEALGVLVQARSEVRGLDVLKQVIGSIGTPERGWDKISAQNAVEKFESTFPNTNKSVVVSSHQDVVNYLTSEGYSQGLIDTISQTNGEYYGITLPDGKVIISTENNDHLDIPRTWMHEQVHSSVIRLFSGRGERVLFGESICNAIGSSDILQYIGYDYADSPIYLLGEEYIAHRIADIAIGNEAQYAVPMAVEKMWEIANTGRSISPDQVDQIIATFIAKILNADGRQGTNTSERDIPRRDSLYLSGNQGTQKSNVGAGEAGNDAMGGLPSSEGTGRTSPQERVEKAESQTDVSPTDAQKEAGNYKKGKVSVLGLEISIENPTNSIRSGVDPNGKKWSIKLDHPYGYILGTRGADKEHIDVHLGPSLLPSTPVFVVNQINPSSGKFDEHKVMLGYPSYPSAKDAYMSAYETGWNGFDSISEINLQDFKQWLKDGAKGVGAPATEGHGHLFQSMDFVSRWHDGSFLSEPYDFDTILSDMKDSEGVSFAKVRKGVVEATGEDRIINANSGKFLSTNSDIWKERIADATHRMEVLQKRILSEGGRIPYEANAWEALNRITSAAKARMDYFDRNELSSLIKACADACGKANMTWDTLGDYLMMKHGIERQEQAGVNVFSDDPSSEWTIEKARQVVADVEAKLGDADTNALWDTVHKATTASLNALYEGGVISQEQLNGYLSRKGWENYVPLRDFDATSDEHPADIFEYHEGAKFATRGTFVKATIQAKGRSSKPLHPIPQLTSMFYSSAAIAEKNIAKLHLLNLTRLNPNRKEYMLNKVYFEYNSSSNTSMQMYAKPENILFDIQSLGVKLFEEIANNGIPITSDPRMLTLTDMVARAKAMGIDPTTVDMVYSQAVNDGVYTYRMEQHKNSILGESDTQSNEHHVKVFEDGEKYDIWFRDPELASAINGTNMLDISKSWLTRTMGAMNRWLAMNFTGKNPAFIPVNFVRDTQYTLLSHAIRHDGEMVRTVANYGKASSAIHRYLSKKSNPLSNEELSGVSLHNPAHVSNLIATYGKDRVNDTLLKMYHLNGGETGYIHMDEIREHARKLRRELEREMGTNPTLDKIRVAAAKGTGIHHAGIMLDYAAYQSENINRYATFLASWEQGKSFSESASDAKNCNVNFNRKGKWGPFMNSIYVFFSAAAAGADNFISRVLLPNKARTMTALSLLAVGSLGAILMSIAYDDNYWKLNEYTRSNCLVIPSFGLMGEGRFITIPLPEGFRSANALVLEAVSAYYDKKSSTEAAMGMMNATFNNFSPMGINPTDLARTAIPSITVPFYDIATNRDFSGRRVYREMFTPQLRDYTPNSQQGMRNVNGAFAWATEQLNAIGGGSQTVPAGVDIATGKENVLKRTIFDINPSKAEHMLTYFAGGRGQFFLDLYNTARPLWDEEQELEARNIPVVRRFITSPSKATDFGSFYQRVGDLERFQHYFDTGIKQGDMESVNQSLTYPQVVRYAAIGKAIREQVQDNFRLAERKGISLDQRNRLLELNKTLVGSFMNDTKAYEGSTDDLAKE